MSGYYNPYESLQRQNPGHWIMANFHMHNLVFRPDQTYEESNEKYEEMAAAYQHAGYEVIMHSSQRDWYDSSEIGEKLGITVLNGQEHVIFRDGILLVNTKKFYDCQPQEAIDDCNANGGFAILCHPNQNPNLPLEGVPLPFSQEQLSQYTGAVGIEIFNGCLNRRSADGVPFGNSLGVDFWDKELSGGKVLWGFGNDDAHEAYEIHVGWTEIYAKSRNYNDIFEAVKRGSLCCSKGLRLEKFELAGDVLTVKAGYTYYPDNQIEYRFIGENGKLLKREEGVCACWKLTDEKYVRVEAVGPDGSKLWTQPLLKKDCYQIPA